LFSPEKKALEVEEVSISLTPNERIAIEHEMAKKGMSSISDYFVELHRHYKDESKSSRQNDQINTHQSSVIRPKVAYETARGIIYCGDSAQLMQSVLEPQSVDLIMTSPPFGLVRQKEYGNEAADQYLEWFQQFAEGFIRVLKPNGSLVIDIGGSWVEGQPTRSLYHFELLIMLCRKYGFHLAQEFYWWNPAKLPTPAEWVNVRRIRVKDAVNCIWWLSPSPYPKTSNRRVLQPYSKSMEHLLKNGYKPKLRPSGHDISDKFQRDNGGAIPPNLIALANTESNSYYQRYCRERGLPEHPARFPAGLPAFFIRMLTDPNDLVLDPFAGSCVTGEVCEQMNRRWVCCELEEEYVNGALGRFEGNNPNEQGSLSEDKEPSRIIGTSRANPYEIFPPNSLWIDERAVPLVQDGGKSRPNHLRKKQQR